MTKAQRRALAALQSRPYIIVPKHLAQWLIAERYARRIVVWPISGHGVAVAKTGTPSAPEREEAKQADRTTAHPSVADTETLHPVLHSLD